MPQVSGAAAGYRSAMSESKNESKDDSGVGISDDQLPEDLVPSEDNPLAEGLPDGERVDDHLTESKRAGSAEDKQSDDDEPDDQQAGDDEPDDHQAGDDQQAGDASSADSGDQGNG